MNQADECTSLSNKHLLRRLRDHVAIHKLPKATANSRRIVEAALVSLECIDKGRGPQEYRRYAKTLVAATAKLYSLEELRRELKRLKCSRISQAKKCHLEDRVRIASVIILSFVLTCSTLSVKARCRGKGQDNRSS